MHLPRYLPRNILHGAQFSDVFRQANGFFGSPKPSGYLPDAYMILARRFLENVDRAGMKSSIKMEEWRHIQRGHPLDGWTYHAKGPSLSLPELHRS
jgi:CDP-diacylglycerol---glycerol-3-phosphate 3-phosphatidyltransferase